MCFFVPFKHTRVQGPFPNLSLSIYLSISLSLSLCAFKGFFVFDNHIDKKHKHTFSLLVLAFSDANSLAY